MLPALLAAILLTLAPARLASPDGGVQRVESDVQVLSVHDGDTITVNTAGS